MIFVCKKVRRKTKKKPKKKKKSNIIGVNIWIEVLINWIIRLFLLFNLMFIVLSSYFLKYINISLNMNNHSFYKQNLALHEPTRVRVENV